MKIGQVRKERSGDRVRTVAHVSWEDCDRPAREIYYEADAQHEADLTDEPNAFVVGAAAPAWFYGENRLAVEGAVCPVLASGIAAVLRQMRAWYEPQLPALALEPSQGFRPARLPAQTRAGCFLSGGVDSGAMARENRRLYPTGHPRSFQDALLVFGADMGATETGFANRDQLFSLVQQHVRPLAADAGLELLVVSTNIRRLAPELDFWNFKHLGAVLASIAQALSPRLSDVSIASPGWAGGLMPCGSHPLIDPYYSTAGQRIHHMHAHVSRWEKFQILADWPCALKHLRVCFNYPIPEGGLNCGKCDRCLYTMLELVAAGRLEQAPLFPFRDVTADMVLKMPKFSYYGTAHLRDICDPLAARGRRDLVEAIQYRLRAREREQKSLSRRARNWVRDVDKRHLGGLLKRGLQKLQFRR